MKKVVVISYITTKSKAAAQAEAETLVAKLNADPKITHAGIDHLAKARVIV